jgi:hypothetical protein
MRKKTEPQIFCEIIVFHQCNKKEKEMKGIRIGKAEIKLSEIVDNTMQGSCAFMLRINLSSQFIIYLSAFASPISLH